MRWVFSWILVAATLAGCQFMSQTVPPTAAANRPPYDPGVIDVALQTERPYVISVLGDSTSQIADGWVYRVASRVADQYHRSVTVHGWNPQTNSYSDVVTLGSGAPVTVWNGSARGQPAQYSAKWYPQMAPEQPDLTIINHSHNNPWGAVAGIDQLVKLAYGNSRLGGGVVVTLQNPRTDDPKRAELEQHVVDQLRETYSSPDTGVVPVDVNKAFLADNLSDLLRPDGLHPNGQGSQLWADTLIASLKLR